MRNKILFLLMSMFCMTMNAQNYSFNGLDMNMGNLSILSNAKTRSISPENFTGEKGKGAMLDNQIKVLDQLVSVRFKYLDFKEGDVISIIQSL